MSPRRYFRDPLAPAARVVQRDDLDNRVSAQEARPRVAFPTPLVPRAITTTPSADWYQATTSATFESLWEMVVPRWSNKAAWAVVPWRNGAATTGELRIARWGGALDPTYTYTSAVSLSSGGSGEVTFLWRHQAPIWGLSGVLWLQARRTGGANSVEIGHPAVAQVPAPGATLTGT